MAQGQEVTSKQIEMMIEAEIKELIKRERENIIERVKKKLKEGATGTN